MGSKIIQLSKQNQAKQTKANLYRLYSVYKHTHWLKSNCMNALKKRSSNKTEEKEEDDDEERNLS